MPLSKRAAAEFFGTFWLVFGGCGSAVLAAGVPSGHRLRRRRLRLRTHCPHHGLRHRPHLRLPFESRRLDRPRRRQALPGIRTSRLHHRPGCSEQSAPRESSTSSQAATQPSLSPAASPPTAMPTTPRSTTRSSPASSSRCSSPLSSCSSSSAPPTSAPPKASLPSPSASASR